MKTIRRAWVLGAVMILGISASAWGLSEAFQDNVYNPGELKPTDSTVKVKVGEPAPDFTLPSMSGEPVTLSQYRGRKHVVLSFVPAAWTPVNRRCPHH